MSTRTIPGHSNGVGVRFPNRTALTTLLEQELRDQGAALARSAQTGGEAVSRAAALLCGADVNHLVIAARGSSDNAARYGQYLLGAEDGLSVGLATPWLFGHGHQAPRLAGAAVLAISQSGRSPDVIAVLAAARAQGRPTIAITNETRSPLAAVADALIALDVGPERSVAATKTYLASLQALARIAAAIAPERVGGVWLDGLPELVSATASEQLSGRERFDRLGDCTLLTAVGRGLDLATAYEAALKLRELSGIPAEAFSPPDLIHGPLGALGPSTGLWIAHGPARAEPEALRTMEEIRRRTGLSVAVSADRRLLDSTEIPIPLAPELPEWVTPIIGVIPAQAAALRLAELRGVEIDAPHGLSKVTITR